MKEKATPAQIQAVTTMFGALADASRLNILIFLAEREHSVGELSDRMDEAMTTVSARLQVLHGARLVARRREGRSIIYSIADDHVLTLVRNALAHASEHH
ncbi:ArsR/SmtB family transcription factor [Reyranella sp.]|uniref:ArsR/SmtB family transcription factor n=1 Tax=Reyranella sp. TaxID=1929291 RepID=UPI003D0F14F6